MGAQRGLLPWIFGGLAIAAVAIAIAMASANRPAASNVAPVNDTGPDMVPAIAAAPPASPAPMGSPAVTTGPAPQSAPAAAEARVQSPSQPVAAGSQIWECTTNGQRTFANRPCGANAVLREVGPANGMDPTPTPIPGRPSNGGYEPQPNEAPEYFYPDTPENPDNASYPVVVRSPLYERRRLQHTHRPPRHDRAPPARRN